MALKDTTKYHASLILDKEVVSQAKQQGDNLSKVTRELLQAYYNSNSSIEKEQAEIDKLRQEITMRQERLEQLKHSKNPIIKNTKNGWIIKKEENNPEIIKEPAQKEVKKPKAKEEKIKKNSAPITSTIVCPKCQKPNIIMNRTALSRKCSHCDFVITSGSRG